MELIIWGTKATVDEAEIEFQVGDEGPHRHGTTDGLLAPCQTTNRTPALMSVVYTGRSPPRSRTRARLVSACSPDSVSTRSTAAPVRPNSRSTRIPANCSWSAVVREALAWREAVVRPATQRPVALASSMARAPAAGPARSGSGHR